MALAFQVSLLATSAFEAGLERYTNGPHVLGVAMLLWFVSAIGQDQRAIAARCHALGSASWFPAVTNNWRD